MISMVNELPVLNGTQIYLRQLQPVDVNENYLSWLTDDEVMSGIATSGYTMQKLKEYVNERLSYPKTAFYAICSKQNNEHIGNIKLDFHDEKSNVSELGLLIGNKEFWGRGVGREACQLLLQYGFNKMGLRKIYLAVYENNPNAKKLYENLGFTLEGVLRKHVAVKGEYFDKYLFGMFNEEYK